jgi:predicted transcriptional regulator
MTKRTIIVGGSLEEAARRVAEAWHQAERGEAMEAEDNVTFASWSALASTMSDKRHELLKHLHRHPAPSLRALARELGRDYKRVYEDVALLESVGLVERDQDGLHADYDEIRTVIAL